MSDEQTAPAIADKPIRVIGYHAENVKMIRVVDFTPKRHVNLVTGPNGSGKSSTIQSLIYGLCSAKSHPSQIIRNGENVAIIRLTLGTGDDVKFIATRRTGIDGESEFTLETESGAVLKKPQHILDAIRDSAGFEPIAFLRMDPKAQMENLRKVVKLDVDLDVIDGEIAVLMEERRLHKPKVGPLEDRKHRARALIDPERNVDPINTQPLLDRIQEVAAMNATIGADVLAREKLGDKAREDRITAEQLRTQARILIEQAEGLEAKAAGIDADLAARPAVGVSIDIATLRAELAELEAERKRREDEIRNREEHALAYGLHKAAVAVEESLTVQIEGLRLQKRGAIARAKMPVPGLSWNEDGVMMNDIPLSEASQAEAIRIAVGIWISQHPVLRILIVRDASLLDDDSLEMIYRMAEEHDFQAWLEIVRKEAGPIGIHMRAGRVVAIDGIPTVHSAASVQ